jgi:molybdopterin/thiamine biosynthesis adenylyltransferase
VSKYLRQRGLIAQDIVADARVSLYGTGPALPYLVQCLALAGIATRHGCLQLCVGDRPVGEADLAGQFLLRPEDLGKPVGYALADRVSEIDAAIDVAVIGGSPAGRGLAIAAPRAEEISAIAGQAEIAAWGQVLQAGVFVGDAPLRTAGESAPNILTAALSAVCGGLLAQTVLGQLGAIISGPAVLSSWFEERLWVSLPGIGAKARLAIATGATAPSLRGVLERAVPADVAERFRIIVQGKLAEPKITAIIDEDAVVVTVPVIQIAAPYATVRPYLASPPPVRPMLWSPIDGPVLDGDRVIGDVRPPQEALPPCRIVQCGVGALGTWAAAILAASGLRDLSLCLVDMDDAVEVHNLNRQVLFGDRDIGLPKADRAMTRLRSINPALDVQALQVMIGPETLDDLCGEGLTYELDVAAVMPEWLAHRERLAVLAAELRRATGILSCPDNHQTRWSLNVIAEHLGIPLVNGAVDGFVGRVHVCDPADHGRCLVCWLGESIAREPERRSCTDLFDAAPVPSIVTSAAVIGAIEAATLIAQHAGLSSRVNRFHAFDGATGTLEGYRAADRDPEECPAHLAGVAHTSSPEPNTPVESI